MNPDTLAGTRDIAIIVLAVLGSLASLAVLIAALLVMTKLRQVLEEVDRGVRNVRGTVGFMSDAVVSPIIRAVSFAAGVRRGVSLVTRVSRNRNRKR